MQGRAAKEQTIWEKSGTGRKPGLIEKMRDTNCIETQIVSVFCWFNSHNFMGYMTSFNLQANGWN